MNAFGFIFFVTNAVVLVTLPRRWAPLPLLVGTCYMTISQEMELGSLHFTVIRMLIAVGFARVILRGERLGRMNSLDRLMLLWAAWALISSLFYKDFSGALINRLGLVYNACGVYFLFRVFCQTPGDVVRLFRITAILLLPLAAAMLYENVTQYNIFSALADGTLSPQIREGRIRAQGPFAHAILAGTVGAACLPLIVSLWRKYRKEAVIGIAASSLIIFTSGSSGPIMTALAAIGALFMWHWRARMRLVRWLAVLSYIGLDLAMKAPVYYLIARIDLTGSSTGWHRARLIESALEHLSEWWLVGTDYTRHWMPYGVDWSGDHTDITNNYLSMGALGGLPLMFLFIGILAKGFSFVGRTLRQIPGASPDFRFIVWGLGASLFAHAVTFISVNYYDNTFVFIYLTLASIGSVWSLAIKADSYSSAARLPDRTITTKNALTELTR